MVSISAPSLVCGDICPLLVCFSLATSFFLSVLIFCLPFPVFRANVLDSSSLLYLPPQLTVFSSQHRLATLSAFPWGSASCTRLGTGTQMLGLLHPHPRDPAQTWHGMQPPSMSLGPSGKPHLALCWAFAVALADTDLDSNPDSATFQLSEPGTKHFASLDPWFHHHPWDDRSRS